MQVKKQRINNMVKQYIKNHVLVEDLNTGDYQPVQQSTLTIPLTSKDVQQLFETKPATLKAFMVTDEPTTLMDIFEGIAVQYDGDFKLKVYVDLLMAEHIGVADVVKTDRTTFLANYVA